MKKILAISGSTKMSSTSHSILKYIQEAYKELVDIELYEGLEVLPHFNPELENNLPIEVAQLRQRIEQADGLLFCTPEYVYSLPGSLKNLIEWNVSTVLFSNKPVAMIVAAASGKKAYESLDLILTTIESYLPSSSKLLIQGAKGKVDTNNHVVDPSVADNIKVLVQSLVESLHKPNPKASKFEN